MGLSWHQLTHSFLVTGHAQHHDSEHIIETCDGNHIGIVIEMCTVFAIFC